MEFLTFTLLAPATSKSSWADEDIELPSARINVSINFIFYSSLAMGLDSSAEGGVGRFPPSADHRIGRGGRDQGPPPAPTIDYARLPTSAPFVTFVGNLPFEICEADLKAFFFNLKLKDIKIPLDHEQKSRGFAIVEFLDQDSLIKAILMGGQVHIGC